MPKKIEKKEVGYIRPRAIVEEMKDSYIDYAMSVIISRALPDVRDGLKPVHRRILYTMLEEGLRHDARFRKSATVVGSTLGRYHPHGDIAVYDALVRMAQDFSLRYPLVESQGNFGSIDGDPPAAQRYTECKLSLVGEEMLKDIEKKTVDFRDNYDGTRKEPIVLPSPLPQLLLNGSLGIAVGMATNIPPHNLSEVIDATCYLIDHPRAKTEDLFQFIKGPDFPTGGEIYNREEIIAAYSQGKGAIVSRGKVEVVKREGKRPQIVITEIPFQVQKSTLVEEFAKLVQEKKLEGIRDIRDESDKEGLRIVMDLSRDTHPKKILNRLYKFTNLQKTFYLNMIALVDGIQPKILSLADVLSYFVAHRKEVVIRRTRYDLKKAKERAHILRGLSIALAKIDAVIKTIKSSKNREVAKRKLMKKFKLTQIQANAILEIKLQTLVKMEREKIEAELVQKKKEIKEFVSILKSARKVKGILRKELLEIKERFGDERKTNVFVKKVGEFTLEDLVPEQDTIITLTKGGYIKRVHPKVYRVQKRGGKGILGMQTMHEDIVSHFILANTHDSLLFFTDSGKVFSIPAYEVPRGKRVARGRGLMNFLDLSNEEKVLTLMTLGAQDKEENIKYLVMITKDGIIKKTSLEEFENIRKSGLIAISLKKGDLLRKVVKTGGEDEIILVTKKGQSIRFGERDIRPMGRSASGVRGIRLKKEDEVVGMEVITKVKKQEASDKKSRMKTEPFLLIVTENGYGKKTNLTEYNAQKRGGSGVKTAKINPKTGNIVDSRILGGKEGDLIVVSQQGQVIRTKISSIPLLSRATQGVRIMRLEKDDKIASATCI